MGRRRNKKGSAQDLILIVVVALVFGLLTLFMFKITDSFNDKFQDLDIDTPGESKAASATMTGHFTGAVDNGFLLLLIGLSIVSLVLASLVRIHPIFIPLFLIAWMFILFLSGVFANIYSEAASTPILSAEADQLTFISLILPKLPWFIGVFGMLLMIVMFKLRSNAEI